VDDPRVIDLAVKDAERDDAVSLLDLLITLAERWKLLLFGSLGAGLLALGLAFAITPTYTATTTFVPPQQQVNDASSLLTSRSLIANMAGLAGAATPSERYVALMESVTVADRIIDRFGLMNVYGAEYKLDARKRLARSVYISIGKKDGLITVDVDDESPRRAADIATAFVAELRQLVSRIAVTEAQQRRQFFEQQLRQTQENLLHAQQALQASGFSQGAVKAEPRAAADGYARLLAEIAVAEVRLTTLRSSLSDDAAEVQQQRHALDALRGQLARMERSQVPREGADFVDKYREFKYQETLFDVFARQYELARVDESGEGALLQVVDVAPPPELKSAPKRAFLAVSVTALTAIVLALYLLVRRAWLTSLADEANRDRVSKLRDAFSFRHR
jgi:uncharacterized protein involved in exopolysaccharide biosynthesis